MEVNQLDMKSPRTVSQASGLTIVILLTILFSTLFSALFRSEEAGKGSGREVSFVDVSAESGIRFQHDNAASKEKYLVETMGSGCAFVDYDQDGFLDIFL